MALEMTDPPDTLRHARTEYRIRDSRVEQLDGGAWTSVPLRRLRERYPVDSPVWDWLRAHGFRRPSPSGASGAPMTDAQHEAAGREKWTLRPAIGTKATFRELARRWGCTLVEAVERAGQIALEKDESKR